MDKNIFSVKRKPHVALGKIFYDKAHSMYCKMVREDTNQGEDGSKQSGQAEKIKMMPQAVDNTRVVNPFKDYKYKT